MGMPNVWKDVLMNKYETIFKKLEKLGVIDLIREGKEAACSKVCEGLMDLHFDLLSVVKHSGYSEVRIALAHNYIQNGDVMADPDMEIRVFLNDDPNFRFSQDTAEALTFQQANPAIYQRVYVDGAVNMGYKKQLNTFLITWLSNALDQGHSFKVM